MQLALTPSAIFQQTQKELSQEHQAFVRSSRSATVLTFALAEMAGRVGVTSENLIGARMLINIFLNLAEKPEVAKQQLPPKDLGSKPTEKK